MTEKQIYEVRFIPIALLNGKEIINRSDTNTRLDSSKLECVEYVIANSIDEAIKKVKEDGCYPKISSSLGELHTYKRRIISCKEEFIVKE